MVHVIKVAVTGAKGRMGIEVVKAVSNEADLSLVAALDQEEAGTLSSILESKNPDVLVDFTKHESALSNIEIALAHRVACVVGTTGFTEADLKRVKAWCEQHQTPALIAPNFAIGAILLMKFAEEAAKHFSWSEIVELHHEKKTDAPSGTALRTAALMKKSRAQFGGSSDNQRARGENDGGIRIHSIRLPGLVAHEEVLFGGLGQTLSIRHDSSSRESFMPGVILAIRKIRETRGLTVGLEHLL